MGRGRAKAKQTKVARELKYNSPNMDLDRLRADLGGDLGEDQSSDHDRDADDGDEFADDEDTDEWSASR